MKIKAILFIVSKPVNYWPWLIVQYLLFKGHIKNPWYNQISIQSSYPHSMDAVRLLNEKQKTVLYFLYQLKTGFTGTSWKCFFNHENNIQRINNGPFWVQTGHAQHITVKVYGAYRFYFENISLFINPTNKP